MTKNKVKQMVPLTLHEQLYETIKEQILNGHYRPGDRITSELQLCAEYNISRVTVRSAIQQLVNEGLLIRKHGKGTFVKESETIESVFTSGSFTDTCLRMNARPSTKIISCQMITSEKKIAEQLGCKDDELILIKRVRLVNDVPNIIELDYFPSSYDFLLKEDLSNGSLLKLISTKTGIIPRRFEDQFRIFMANKEFAGLLSCERNIPLLEVTQQVSDSEERAIYINKQYILTSKYVYVVRSSK